MAEPTQIGPYQILARIASGGMGTVYHALHTEANREIALKVLRTDRSDDPDFIKRFEREANIMAELRHPNIAQVFQAGFIDEGILGAVYFIEMEYLPGGNLHTELKNLRAAGQYMPIGRALNITRQITAALDFAHRRGLVHRDIKPSNILIGNDSQGRLRYVLTDFGIVWYSDATQLTQTSQVMGTPEYMSPEQCQAQNIDARSDLYSIGCVLYETLVGDPPFTAEVPIAVTFKQVQDVPQPPSAIRSDVPESINDLVLKLLAKQPRQRHQNARQLLESIDRIVRIEPLVGFEPGDPTTIVDEPAVVNSSATAGVPTPSRTTPKWVSPRRPKSTVVGQVQNLWVGRPSVRTVLLLLGLLIVAIVVVVLIGNAASSMAPIPEPTPTVVAGLAETAEAAAAPTMQPTLLPESEPTLAPTPTVTESEPLISAPVLTVTADFVNVRNGPDIRYASLGQLEQGQVLDVVGRSEDGQWLQISYPAAPDARGWVKIALDDVQLVQPNEAVNLVPVAAVPTLPPINFPAPVCPNPFSAGITSPQHAETIAGQLLIYGNAEVPDGGYAKMELRQDAGWQFIGEVRVTTRGGLLGRIQPAYFSSLRSGLALLRLVVVDAVGQEIRQCQIAVAVAG